jgi:hypothetical protein
MNTSSPSARRAYRQLGYLALAHAVVLLGSTALSITWDGPKKAWLVRLWVGLVTLWFLWPVALTLHRGRSILRFAALISLTAVLLWPSLRFYDMHAPEALGLPDGVRMNPLSAWTYFSAYRAGRAEAEKDGAAGILVIEEYGFGAGSGGQILRERYQIETRAIAQCAVDEKILGHAAGYNSVSEPEIHRRFGGDNIAAAREEGIRLQGEERDRHYQLFKNLTRRLSSIPPGAKVTTESVLPDPSRDWPLSDPIAEEELAQFVHAVEKCVVEAVPADTPAFKLSVNAELTPAACPTFEGSLRPSAPNGISEAIFNGLRTIPPPKWSIGGFYVHFDFAIREGR